MSKGDKLIKEFRAGSVAARIWQEEVVGKDGKPFKVFGVCVERRHLDAWAQWLDTVRFDCCELADLELVVFKAREFLSLADSGRAER